MGNIPAKITGKYQSYDINTTNQVMPPSPLKRSSDPYQNHNEAVNTLSQQQSPSENSRYDYDNDRARINHQQNSHHNEEDHSKWRQQQNHAEERHSKRDSYGEEILETSQHKLEESIYTDNPNIRDSRVMEGSLGELSPNINTLRNNHMNDDDDDGI